MACLSGHRAQGDKESAPLLAYFYIISFIAAYLSHATMKYAAGSAQELDAPLPSPPLYVLLRVCCVCVFYFHHDAPPPLLCPPMISRVTCGDEGGGVTQQTLGHSRQRLHSRTLQPALCRSPKTPKESERDSASLWTEPCSAGGSLGTTAGVDGPVSPRPYLAAADVGGWSIK